MAVEKLNLDSKAIEAIMRSPEVQAELKRRADAIARGAGPGFRSEVKQGRGDRAIATVWTGTYEARKAQAHDRALTKAIDAGRS